MFGLVRHERDALHALGAHRLRDRFDGQRAVHRLAAGHRDGVVVQDLVRDVRVGGDRLANGHRAGVIEGAVAEVLERVLAIRKH